MLQGAGVGGVRGSGWLWIRRWAIRVCMCPTGSPARAIPGVFSVCVLPSGGEGGQVLGLPHRHTQNTGTGSHTSRDKGEHSRQGGGAQRGRRGSQNSGHREPEWRGWESVHMGGSNNKGYGLAHYTSVATSDFVPSLLGTTSEFLPSMDATENNSARPKQT